MERALIAEYTAIVGELLEGLDGERVALAIEIAASADAIRGYGPVKAAHVERTRRRWTELMTRWRSPNPATETSRRTQAA